MAVLDDLEKRLAELRADVSADTAERLQRVVDTVKEVVNEQGASADERIVWLRDYLQ